MNTPAHLIFGMAAFGKPAQTRIIMAALAGAMIPDLSLYLMAGYQLQIVGTPARVVFGEMYFSMQWQQIFRIDNSIVLWGMALCLALGMKSRFWVALCGAALLHLFLDFPLHHDDGRAHFWPLSTWIFESPVSYWDWRHHGRIVGMIEMGLSGALCVWMFFRFERLWERVMILLLGALEILPRLFFALIFSGGPPS